MEEKKKRKIRVWGKINLLETSAVGIPAYPFAHLNTSCSLVKSLAKAMDGVSDELNGENTRMEPDEEKPEEPEKAPEVEPEEDSGSESETSEEEKKPEPEAEKSIDATKMLAKALKSALTEIQTERGLVSSEDSMEKVKKALKEKSTGELAIMSGLFRTPEVMGASKPM